MNATTLTVPLTRLAPRARGVSPTATARRRSAGMGLLGMSVAAMLAASLKSRTVRSSRRNQAALSGAALTAFALGLNRLLHARPERASSQPMKIDRSITIKRSPAEVYAYWRELEHLPNFMTHLESVKTTDRISTWRAKSGLGVHLEWQAEITWDRDGEGFAWRSLPGASVPNCGAVQFAKAPGDRGTEVRMHLEYYPPGRALGAAFARLFKGLPGMAFDSDLRRLKQILETGEVVHSDASIHRGLHAARPPQGRALSLSSGKAGS